MALMNVVFDAKRMRPACALLQAILGGDQGIANAFDSDTWLTASTPDMRLYRVTPDELRKLVKMAAKRPEREDR